MAYPQAPWTLQGYALQTLHLIDIDQVRPLVPSELEIVSVWPGKTVGGIYIASYGSGSVLEYNELIVVGALTRHSGKLGGWVSHIYVDNPDSVAGGREIWGLPKEIAQFTWEDGKPYGVQVRQEETLLCTLNCQWQIPGWRQPLNALSFSALHSDLLLFEANSELNFSLVGAKLQIPSESPFSSILGFNQPWLSFYGDQLRLVVNEPQAVGERATAFSYS
jgi:hypothetical protein